LGRTQWNFRPGFLHLVFAEQTQTELRRRRHDLRRLAFCNYQQGNGARIASRAFARRVNPLLDFFKIFGEVHGTIVNRKL
jgi:hypothetical protein